MTRGCGFDSWKYQKVFLNCIQTSPEAHPASHSVGTGIEADHSPSSSAEIKNA